MNWFLRHLAGISFGAMLAPGIALAQGAGAVGERVGPDAKPLPTPEYAEPRGVDPAPAAPLPPAPLVATPGGGDVQLAGVAVAVEGGSGGTAVAKRDAGTGEAGAISYAKDEPLDAAWIERQFRSVGLIGGRVGYDRIVDLVQRINRAYLANGYVNTGVLIADQGEASDGAVLRLRLVQGRIVPGTAGGPLIATEWRNGRHQGLTDSFIAARMPGVRAVPFDAVALERDFRLLAENPAISTIDARIVPGSAPGEASLAVTIDPALRYDLYFSFANERSPSVGGERYAVGGSVRNLLSGGDIIAGEYGKTKGLDDATFSYTTPLFDPDLTATLRWGFNNAAVVDSQLRPLDIRSKDRTIEAGLAWRLVNRPLTPTPTPGEWISARTISVGATGVHRVNRSFLLGDPFSFSPGSEDGRARYDAVRFNADLVDRNVAQVLALSLTASVGIDGTRSSEAGVASPPRNFVALLGQANYARRLDDDGLELRARISGQYTGDVLYSQERFSIGGEGSVRGYRENLILTDRGLSGTVELAKAFTLGRRSEGRAFQWGAFAASAFVDGAWGDNVGTVDPAPRSLYSVGASLAWTPSPALFARITYAKGLEDVTLGVDNDLQDDGIQFRIVLRPLALFLR